MLDKPHAHPLHLWAFPLGLIIAVSVFSSYPVAPLVPQTVVSQDKLIHFAVFGLLATALYRAAIVNVSVSTATIIAISTTALFGLLDELHQGFTPDRHMNVYDWLADVLGAIIAVSVYRCWKTYQQCLEFRPFRWLAKEIQNG